MAIYVGPTMDALRRYAGLSPDGDAQTLELCMHAAKIWFANAGVREFMEGNALYNLGVYMLATHYYDNRGVLDSSGALRTDIPLPFGVLSIMHQLRL
ncbi:MAG: head-tail connector protein [Clostridia bacterium]